jgi:hypothetical protein
MQNQAVALVEYAQAATEIIASKDSRIPDDHGFQRRLSARRDSLGVWSQRIGVSEPNRTFVFDATKIGQADKSAVNPGHFGV